MKNIDSFKDYLEIREHFRSIGNVIREGAFPDWRRYGLGVMHAVKQAVHCNYTEIALIALGIERGRGLLSLCHIAEYFEQEFNIDIRVYGFDTGVGLPPPSDFRDHPELWSEGQYSSGDVDALKKRLPECCDLIVGEFSDTIPAFCEALGNSRRIGFVSVELHHYSSAVSGLKIFDFPPSSYLPAVPMFVDNVETLLTYSQWSGEALAISEFNQSHEKRKIDRKNWRILRFHLCHILDHPIRTGMEPPRAPLVILDV
jgi:hypothetical protein